MADEIITSGEEIAVEEEQNVNELNQVEPHLQFCEYSSCVKNIAKVYLKAKKNQLPVTDIHSLYTVVQLFPSSSA